MSQKDLSTLVKGPYRLQVDYSTGLKDALAEGRFAWVNDRLTSANFPAPQAGTATLSGTLVPFSAEASLDYVRSQAAPGTRPATLWELLAFAKAYPDVQTRLDVIGLGSYADLIVNTYESFPAGNGTDSSARIVHVIPRLERLYPYLAGNPPGRMVGLEWLGDPAGYETYYALFVSP